MSDSWTIAGSYYIPLPLGYVYNIMRETDAVVRGQDWTVALKSTTVNPIRKFAELTSFYVDLMGNNTDKKVW